MYDFTLITSQTSSHLNGHLGLWLQQNSSDEMLDLVRIRKVKVDWEEKKSCLELVKKRGEKGKRGIGL